MMEHTQTYSKGTSAWAPVLAVVDDQREGFDQNVGEQEHFDGAERARDRPISLREYTDWRFREQRDLIHANRELIIAFRADLVRLIDQAQVEQKMRLDASTALSDARWAASQTAVSKVEATNETRFQSVNEFREQLRDQAGTFATKEVLDALQKQTNEIQNTVTRLDAKTLAYAGALGVFFILVQIAVGIFSAIAHAGVAAH
jgi:uncharacterized protein (UPF0305 family)